MMPTRNMKRWSIPQINAAIRAIFEEQSEDPDFASYEESTGVLYRANSAMTAELVAMEKQYKQFGLVEVEHVLSGFPVSGVFIQGIEGYAIYRGSLYRLLNLARLTPRTTGTLQCAMFSAWEGNQP